MGAHSINYNKNYTSYVRAGITGKIESLGEQNLSITKMTVIQKWLLYREIIQVGSVVIDINKPYARTEYKSGKIKAIETLILNILKIPIKIVLRELMENSKVCQEKMIESESGLIKTKMNL